MARNSLRFTNTRCSICNKVSSQEIETELGDYTDKGFVPDPSNPLFYICDDCKEEHEGLMREYEIEDYYKEMNL